MVNPTYGPTTVYQRNNYDGIGSWYRRVDRYKQTKPYNLVLPYYMAHVYTSWARLRGSTASFGGNANANSTRSWAAGYPSPDSDNQTKGFGFKDEIALATDSARAKFMSRLPDLSMMAVNFFERKQSMGMIANRALQLYGFTKALRRGDIVGAARALNVHGDHRFVTNRQRWARSNNWANTFLEFHFGWEPLLKDIYSAVDLLQGDIPHGQVFGLGRKIAIDSDVYQLISPGYQEYRWGIIKGRVRARVGSTVVVSNPNLYLANRLGLLNPVSTAWELVPFSFVVGWFVNVSEFLEQFTDTIGLTFVDPYTTWVAVLDTCNATYHWTDPATKQLNGTEVISTGRWMRRVRGIPSVTLKARTITGISPVRAATAISLLVQKGLKVRAV